mmetsp:Transcript_75549/g.179488  ORF Transcript_75549/g.179488 Transcript_75549/m.179488 type:complete len:496 (-) Transcript_75549:221-1708(-)|eukprot:CAMPEP_0178411704 /NCGR_PEP_ID=MMETSP0689_2-20121128/21630_1 /TAXON_ID=160604 /ORGANISM="Amphidinium massartii, Strain CS-259" /LENGTH=495 /DNA_ID=CAMNT_0020032915 /DNA_START=167 /DNA_END=1654 /DNA_ORIENTATION=-
MDFFCSILGPTLGDAAPNARQAGARTALLALTAINLLSYADRYIPSAVKTPLQQELQLTDAQTALPTTAMVISYMIFAVLFGTLADKQVCDRRLLLAVGVALWSLATALTSIVQTFPALVFYRSLVGVGEAAFVAIVPPMLSDFYPRSERNLALAVFYLAMPLGSAIGFGVAAAATATVGWRAAFLFCGGPGLLVSCLVLRINDPARGINDQDGVFEDAQPLASQGEGQNVANYRGCGAESASQASPRDGSNFVSDAKTILSNPHYLAATFGLVAQMFAIGALVEWFITLMVRSGTTSQSEAAATVGVAVAIGGFLGILLGSKVAQSCEGHIPSAYFLVPAIATLPTTGFAILAVLCVGTKLLSMASIVLAMVAWNSCNSPIYTISVSVIPVPLRARSAGIQMFLLHMLGDMLSPPVVGYISDRTGSLQFALTVSSLVFLFSGAFWGFGALGLKPLPLFRAEEEETTIGFVDILCSADAGEPDSVSKKLLPDPKA